MVESKPLINPVRPDEWAYYLPLEGTSMFEFGGKQNPDLVKGREITYKSYFQALGYRHVSVDWDGRFGALVRDLRRPQWPEFGQFDMVCDIGTAEHVDGQKGFWENVHNLTKVGGLYVGQHPAPGGKNWYWHGTHYPTAEFYRQFATLNGWQIERIGYGRKPPRVNLYARMRRVKELPFTMPDESLIYWNRRRPR